MLYESFANFNTVNNFLITIYMRYGNGKSNRGICQYSNSLTETYFTYSYNFHWALKKLFRMALMCGLLLLANQGMSRRQCNSKCSAKNKCYLTAQEQTSRVPALMYHIHGLHVMPCIIVFMLTHFHACLVRLVFLMIVVSNAMLELRKAR